MYITVRDTIKNASSDSDNLGESSSLPLPALIAIPIMSVFAFAIISFLIYTCVRNYKLRSAFKEQSSIPKIDLTVPPRGFDIDEHTVTPYPPTHQPNTQYPTFSLDNDQSQLPLLPLDMRDLGGFGHSRTSSQEGLLRNRDQDEVQDSILPPPAYTMDNSIRDGH